MSSGGPTGNGMIESILSESKYIKINGLEVDIQKWSKMSSWTVMQAVCIFHGIDPMRGLQDKYLKHLSIYKNIMDAYDVMENAASDKKIPNKGDPALFIDWAELVVLPVSDELKDAVHDEAIKRSLYSLEKQVRMEETIAALEREKKDRQVAAEPKPLERDLLQVVPKFIFRPRSTTYGYFPALEEVLEEERQAGEPIPDPTDVYDRMVAKQPKLVDFSVANRTLTYIKRDGERSRVVDLKAIGQAIAKRTEYK